MDSALSRHMIISLEERKGRSGVRSSGFSTLAPIALESRLRRWVRDAGNWSQRMNRRSSPNRFLIRSWWRTARAMDVFPIPPGPMRATGVRSSAKPTTSSISSPRPKQTLGRGGGDSPGTAGWGLRFCIYWWLDHRRGLTSATHLTTHNSVPNLIHESRQNLGILIASPTTHVIDAVR